MAGFAVWPVSFIWKAHELEYCPLSDQGILANATVGDNGWLCGLKGEAMCQKPPDYWPGLLQQAVHVLGALDTVLNIREFVYGTEWEWCATNYLDLGFTVSSDASNSTQLS